MAWARPVALPIGVRSDYRSGCLSPDGDALGAGFYLALVCLCHGRQRPGRDLRWNRCRDRIANDSDG